MRRAYFALFTVMLIASALAADAGGAPAPTEAAPPAPTGRGTFGDVSFPTPDAKHWKAEVQNENMVFISLDAKAPDWAVITVFASKDFPGDSAAFHKAYAQAISHDLSQRGVTKLVEATPLYEQTPKPGVEILKQVVTTQGDVTNQRNLYVGIHAGNRIELIAYQTNGQATFDKFVPDAQKVFQDINVNTPGEGAAKADPAAPPEKAAANAPAVGGFGAMLHAVRPDAVGAADGARPAKVPVAIRGERQIDGLFRFQRTTTMLAPDLRRIVPHLEVRHFYFFPDGHVFFGFPIGGNVKEHPTAADYAPFEKSAPEDCGTYVIANGKITLKQTGSESGEAFEFKLGNPADGTAFDFSGGIVVKLFPFKAGERISGKYSNDQIVASGMDASAAYIASGLTFDANGTVSSESWVGVEDHLPINANTSGRGTYELDGYRLTLTIGGKPRTATICRYESQAKGQTPDTLFIDGHVYQLKK